MAFTRAQATSLLNKAEMRLYDESRANALRGLDAGALATRIERSRAARDRARDLLKRQRLAARKRGEGRDQGIAARTGRKEALLADILDRFTKARKAAGGASRVKKAAAVAPAKKALAKATAKKATARKSTAARKAGGARVATASVRLPEGATRPRRVSPTQALQNTRELLAAKQERDRTPQAWQSLDPAAPHVPQAGYQSPDAAAKAQDLHAAESRMASIHGSMARRDRRKQGQRDHRGDED